MTEEVRVSHLLLLVDEKALPKDTLAVYQKINSLRNKILNGGILKQLLKLTQKTPLLRLMVVISVIFLLLEWYILSKQRHLTLH